MEDPAACPPAHSMGSVIFKLVIAFWQWSSLTMGTWRYSCTDMDPTGQQTWADWRVLEATEPVEPQPGGTHVGEQNSIRIDNSYKLSHSP